jgi:hypothetical protein
MSDQQLSDLFAEGTAPEHDPAFTLLVASEIGRARLRRRLLALALRVIVLLILSAPLFVVSRQIAPMLAQLVEGWPQFMGVPVPLVLCALVVALALRTRFFLFPLRVRTIFPVW